MALDLMREKGVPLDQQLDSFNWRDMVQSPVSKLDMTPLPKFVSCS